MNRFSKALITCVILMLSCVTFYGCACDRKAEIKILTFDTAFIEMKVGDVYDINVNIIPEKASKQKVVFYLENNTTNTTSGKKTIVKLNDGELTAMYPGVSTLIASSKNGQVTARLEIRVFDKSLTLPAPTGIDFKNDRLSWNAVTYKVGQKDLQAEYYIVNIDGEDLPKTANTYYDGIVAGQMHDIKIKAVGSGKFVSDSLYSDVKQIKILKTPTNLELNNGLLSWKSDEENCTFTIYKNKEILIDSISSKHYNINIEEFGEYVLNVRAVPNGADSRLIPSYFSNDVSVKKMEKPSNVDISNSIISWNAVDNCNIYAVNFKNIDNLAKSFSVNTSTNRLNLLMVENKNFIAGNYNVSVVAVSNATIGLNSEESNIVEFKKLSIPTGLSVYNNKLIWNKNAESENFNIKVNGEFISTEKENFSLPENYQSGEYVITMCAIGNGKTTINSDWISEDDAYITYKLETPKNLSFNQNILTFNSVDNASTYKLYDANITENNSVEPTFKNGKIINGNYSCEMVLPEKEFDINISNLLYKIKVQAIAPFEGNYFNSQISEEYVSFYQLYQLKMFGVCYINQGNANLVFSEQYDVLNTGINCNAFLASCLNFDYGLKYKFYQNDENGIMQEIFKIEDFDWIHTENENKIPPEKLDLLKSGIVYITAQIMPYSHNGQDVPNNVIFSQEKYCIEVEQVGENNYIPVGDENIASLYKSQIPKNVIINDDRINWINEAINSDKITTIYRIYKEGIDNNNLPNFSIATGSQIDLSDLIVDNNEYIVEMYNVEEGAFFRSNIINLKISRLQSPTIEYYNNEIYWAPVSNATGYKIIVDGNIVNWEYELIDDKYVAKCNLTESKIYNINVVATNNNANNVSFINSLESNDVTVTKLVIDSYSLQKNKIEIVTGILEDITLNVEIYKVVSIDGGVVLGGGNDTKEILYKAFETSNNIVDLYKNIVDSGNYKVYVVAKCNESNVKYIYSEKLEINETIIKYEVPSIAINNKGVLQISSSNNSNKYEIIATSNDETIREIVVSEDAKFDLTVWNQIIGGKAYEITVICIGNENEILNSKVSNVVTFERVITVQNLNGQFIENIYNLTWDNVPNAKYDVYLNDVKYAGGLTNSIISLNERVIENVGKYKFTVRAVSTQQLYTSNYSEPFVMTKFNVISNLSIDNNILSFNKENDDFSAILEINGNNYEIVNNEYDLTSIEGLFNGEYSATIYLKGNDANYISSDKVLVNFSKVNTVSNLKIDSVNNVLTWNSVGLSSKYIVKFNEDIFVEVDTNSCEFPNQIPSGSVIASVSVKGNGKEIIDSVFCSPISFVKLAQPSNIRIVNDYVKFDKLGGVNKYSICVVLNEDYVIPYEEFIYTETGYLLDFSVSGSYQIFVNTVGDYVNTISSTCDNPIEVGRMFAVQNINISNSVISWEQIKYATSFELTFEKDGIKTVRTTTTNSFEINPIEFESGLYTLMIQPKSSLDNVLKCEATMYNKTINILNETNQIKFNENKNLMWNNVEGAYGYKVYLSKSGNVQTFDCNANEFVIPSNLQSGEWTVYVESIGNNVNVVNSKHNTAFNFEKFKTPSKVFHNAKSLTVTEVEGVSNYTIVIKNGDNVDEIYITSSSLTVTYEFNNDGIYEIYVKCNGDFISTIDSDLSNVTNVIRLNRITNERITISNNVVTWLPDLYFDAIHFDYVVKYKYGETIVKTVQIKENYINFYDESLAGGSYEISVTVVPDSQIEYLPSLDVYCGEMYKLNTPKINNLLDNNKIMWTVTDSKYSSVSGYEIIITNSQTNESQKFITNTKEENNFELDDRFEAGKYFIKVSALGNGSDVLASSFTDEKEIIKLETPEIFIGQLDKNKGDSVYAIKWQAVANASAYKVFINDTIVTTMNNYYIIDDDSLFAIGLNKVKVSAIGNFAKYSNSKISNESSFEIRNADDAALCVKNGEITWTNMENASHYSLIVNMSPFDTINNLDERIYRNENNFTFDMSGFGGGEYQILLKAYYKSNDGTNNVIVNTKYSTPISCYKIDKPKNPTISNGVVIIENPTKSISQGHFEQDDDKNVINCQKCEFVYGLTSEYDFDNEAQLSIRVYSGEINFAKQIKFRQLGNSYYVNSDWSNCIYGTQLETVTNIKMEHGNLIWSPVENASGYMVVCEEEINEWSGELYNEHPCIIVNNATSILKPFYKNGISGKFTVKIIAIGSKSFNTIGNPENDEMDATITTGYTNSLDSETFSFIYNSVVQNIQTNEGLLTWEGENTFGFDIKYLIDGKEYIKHLNSSITECNFDFLLKPGKYEIQISKTGNTTNVIDGDYSSTITIYKMNYPVSKVNGATIFLDNGLLSWQTSAEFLNGSDYDLSNEEDLNLIYDLIFKKAQLLFINTSGNENVVKLNDISTIYDSAKNVFISKSNQYIEGLDGGSYSLRILNIGSTTMDETFFIESTYCDEFDIRIHKKPIDLKVVDGVLTWTHIEGNSGYMVVVNDDTYIVNDEKFDINQFTSGVYNVYVRTIGDSINYLSSAKSINLTVTKLNHSENLLVNNGELVWKNVNNSTAYRLIFTNTERVVDKTIIDVKDFTIDENNMISVDMEELEAGKYIIEMIVYGDGSSYITSDKYCFEGFEVNKMSSITNVSNDYGQLVWKIASFENGDLIYKYKVKVTYIQDDVEVSQVFECDANPSLEMSSNIRIKEINGISYCYYQLDDGIPSGVINVSVKAIGDSTINLNSSYSNPLNGIKLETVEGLNINKGMISWTYAKDGYMGFYLNIKEGSVNLPTSDLITTFSVEFPSEKPAGEYSVYIRVAGNTLSSNASGVRYFSSSLSEEFTVTKLAEVSNFFVKQGMLVWDQTKNASSYEITLQKDLNDIVIEVPKSNFDSSINKCFYEVSASETYPSLLNGTYSNIRIRALGGEEYINSQPIQLKLGESDEVEKIMPITQRSIVPGIDDETGIQSLNLIWQASNYISPISNEVVIIRNYRLKLYIDSVTVATALINYDDGDFVTIDGKDLSIYSQFKVDLNSLFTISSGSYLLAIQAVPLPYTDDKCDAFVSNYSEPVSVTKPANPSKLAFYDNIKAFRWDAPDVDKQLSINYEVTYGYSTTSNGIYSYKTIITTTNLWRPLDLGFYKVIVKASVSGSLSSDYVGENGVAYLDIKNNKESSYNEYDFIQEYGAKCQHNLFERGNGTQSEPYIISSNVQFQNVNYYSQGGYYFKLTQNLNLSGYLISIGSKTQPFDGYFDGASNSIINVTYNTNNEYIGLFAYVDGGTICNLNVSTLGSIALTKNANTKFGILVGYGKSISIDKVKVYGNINISATSTSSNSYYVGGVIGYCGETQEDKVVTSNLITYTINNANINYNVTSSLNIYAGGIAGYFSTFDVDSVGIQNSGNNGAISGTICGGIYASGAGNLRNCFNANTITATASNSMTAYAGGLIGRGTDDNNILHCYSVGDVTAKQPSSSTSTITAYAGGVYGYGDGVVRNFYNSGNVLTIIKNTSSSNSGIIAGKTSYITLYDCYTTTNDTTKVSNGTCEGDLNVSTMSSLAGQIGSEFEYSSYFNRVILKFEKIYNMQ